jgi:phosphomannomutase
MHKENLHFDGDLPALYANLKGKFKDAKINEKDGIRFDFPDQSWIHIRTSNTEPLVRIFGEAKTKAKLDELFQITDLTLKEI